MQKTALKCIFVFSPCIIVSVLMLQNRKRFNAFILSLSLFRNSFHWTFPHVPPLGVSNILCHHNAPPQPHTPTSFSQHTHPLCDDWDGIITGPLCITNRMARDCISGAALTIKSSAAQIATIGMCCHIAHSIENKAQIGIPEGMKRLHCESMRDGNKKKWKIY